MIAFLSVMRAGTIFDAQVVVLNYKSIIGPGFTCVLHIHSVTEGVTVKVRGMMESSPSPPLPPSLTPFPHRCTHSIWLIARRCFDTQPQIPLMRLSASLPQRGHLHPLLYLPACIYLRSRMAPRA